MCGIFFSIGFEDLPPSVIDSVSHRGPDGRGWEGFDSPHGPVVMAHRRLAILDLSEDGHQPMSSDDGRYWVTYNGEIYNYLEIRKELEELGYHFRTKTDTEVLLKSYLHWGEDCLHHFNGMFAFVIWDDKDKKVFAARDRFGVKPLYYYRQGNKIAFASEIKQFTSIPNFQSKLDTQSAFYYFLGSYTNYSSKTFFQNVTQLYGGECLSVDLAKFNTIQRKWYSIDDFTVNASSSYTKAQEDFKKTFFDAINLRLRSDVKIGACLSGGIDSSAIVSVVRELLSNESASAFHTFSACYPGDPVDESIYMDCVTEHTGFLSHKVFPDPKDLMADLEKVVYHHDQPIGGATVYAQWCVFKKAREKGIKVILDGQGSDEIFGGYHSMLAASHNELFRGLKLPSLLKEFKDLNRHFGYQYKTMILRILEDSYPKVFRIIAKSRNHNFINPWIKDDFFTEKNVDPFSSSFRNIVNLSEEFSIKNLNDISKLKVKYTLPSLLHCEDKNSMAHSIESRTPFLDFRLVELALSLPSHMKIQNSVTKKIIRDALKGILPDKIIQRKDKLGFAVPETKWMSDPKTRRQINQMISGTINEFPEIFQISEVNKILKQEFFNGQFFALWPILDFGIFMNKFNLKA